MSLQQLKQPWRFIDQTTLGPGFDALQSFAIDDTLCTSIGTGDSEAVVRAWVHHQTIVLGIQDSRLPMIKEGVQFLRESGYRAIVRNSGGLAVVLDEGILNLSLIVKEEKKFSINHGYDLMYALIQAMFADKDITIEAKEIVGSYCPGSYDLSIGGKKFAGISQRRIRGGVAVQIYLCVTNSGSERAALIGKFYDLAVQGQPVKFDYPTITPKTMASLSELLGEELTIQSVMYKLLTTLNTHGAKLLPSQLTADEMNVLDHHYERVLKRNEKALEE
ncbi:lipoate--protein ligase family protein [Desertibacillus haloalkaliphilus]|uniref:lipoate--protein ligase family protein n=1 Tax=Desertibacillus haloalkaliphilus TaxID=1328930 RepID=UPI001C25DCDD|nr:biotin/lipoate A/B protein ligase family protein [Desertibacillus haloalkaliphilus]MBU8905830.1 lipoate--protein ligase family protein [Desertibacillus haloalkaliphilus]